MIITTLTAAFSDETTVAEAWAQKSAGEIATSIVVDAAACASMCVGAGVFAVAGRVVLTAAGLGYDSYLASQTFDTLMKRLRNDMKEKNDHLKEQLEAQHTIVRRLSAERNKAMSLLSEKEAEINSLQDDSVEFTKANNGLQCELNNTKAKLVKSNKKVDTLETEAHFLRKTISMLEDKLDAANETITVMEMDSKLKVAIIERKHSSLIKPVIAFDSSAIVNLYNSHKVCRAIDKLATSHKVIITDTVFREVYGVCREAYLVLKELLEEGKIEKVQDSLIAHTSKQSPRQKYGSHLKDITIEQTVADYSQQPVTLVTDDLYMGGWAIKTVKSKKKCTYGELHEHISILTSPEFIGLLYADNK